MADAPVIAAPVVEAPAPVVSAPAPVAATETAAPAPVVEAPAPVVEAAAPLVSEVPSLLETLKATPDAPKVEAEAPKVDAPKVEAAKVEGEAPKVDEKPVEAKPVEVEKPAWKFELPETLKADDKVMGEFTSLLDAIVAPSEALTREAAGQKLLNMHNDALVAYDAAKNAEQHRAFNAMRRDWQTAAMADPEIGGSGHETAMRAIARMRDQFVSSAKPGTAQYAKDTAEFNEALRITGAGDHPAILKVFHNVAQMFDEPRLPPSNPNPPPGNGPRPNGKTVLYDNPRSSTGRQ
jgi:hypothetical protein